MLGTRKYDSCESLEDPSRRSEEHRKEFLDQTALQDSIQHQEETCQALRERVQVAKSAVDNVPALFALVSAYYSDSPPTCPLGACVTTCTPCLASTIAWRREATALYIDTYHASQMW